MNPNGISTFVTIAPAVCVPNSPRRTRDDLRLAPRFGRCLGMAHLRSIGRRSVVVAILTLAAACGGPLPESGGASDPSKPNPITVGEKPAPPTAKPELDCSQVESPRCVGAPAPAIKLTDFQPKSPRHGTKYGLEAFQGRVTLAVLLAGW